MLFVPSAGAELCAFPQPRLTCARTRPGRRRSSMSRAASASAEAAPSPSPPSQSPPVPTDAERRAMRGLSLRAFGEARGWSAELSSVVAALEETMRAIASRVRRAALSRLESPAAQGDGAAAGGVNASGDEQKPLDVLTNELMTRALLRCRAVSAVASEEEDEVLTTEDDGGGGAGGGGRRFAVVFDPLDGSSNVDACIPTGTIFGVYAASPRAADGDAAVLQSGAALQLAGYCLYSFATVIVLSDGDGTHEFVLDAEGAFVLSEAYLRVKSSGSSYSVNDGRVSDWPEGLRAYIQALKRGEGRQRRRYDTRYICSLVADVHYVLKHGGVAMNPRDHLRLVYEANPIAFAMEHAGGRAVDGERDILGIEVHETHQRLPLFVGSADDIDELQRFHREAGGVQQVHNPGYKY